MFYNVIITDNEDNEFYNQLVFSFETLDEALGFAYKVLSISDYSVEILKLEDGVKDE